MRGLWIFCESNLDGFGQNKQKLTDKQRIHPAAKSFVAHRNINTRISQVLKPLIHKLSLR